MTPSAAILALLITSRPPAALLVEAERLALPAAPRVALEVYPYQRELRLRTRAPEALARHLRGASKICPDARAEESWVALHCRTSFVEASIVRAGGSFALDVHELRVPPWRPELGGPPLLPFRTESLGLGACPGATPAAAGECALAAGDLGVARERFEAAGPDPLALLRLGDLALQDGDPARATAIWKRIEGPPFGALAAARLCELDPACVRDPERLKRAFALARVPAALYQDIALRRARVDALLGNPLGAAGRLAAGGDLASVCGVAPEFCREVLLAALESPGPGGIAALALYLEMPGRGVGPLALPLVRAAADRAEDAGAPRFAANLLAASAGIVPDAELGPHLARAASLFLEAGDRARAEEVVRFARTRLSREAFDGSPWAELRREIAAAGRQPRATPPSEAVIAEVAAARRAVAASRDAAARALTPRPRPPSR